MRYIRVALLAGAAAFAASPAFAADALKFGPPPAWVHAQKLPSAKPTDAPIAVLLQDQQVAFAPGKVTTYSEGAIEIENPQGLAAGNLSMVWQPATETVTINKLHIIRDGKVIDVLAGGQTFTVLRRETNLDAATLDGTLTATIQPEGLEAGDIIDLATTIERSDPVLKGHVEAMFGAWDALPIQLAHATLNWPSTLHIYVHETPNLPAAQKSSTGGMNVLELTGEDVQPLVPPKGAPERYRIGRLAEATDFDSWADIANLMSPLFHDAAVIPASGPLHDEVEKIRSSAADPKARATQALALVQDRVRYVALLMGEGGYVPASAEQTWSRRFGDCKAKTALLLGILHSLGIQAEAVLVQAKLGDMVADRLPMIGLFNHVLVRAHIGGRDYWLDGTRTGDSELDAIRTPNFGWALPLIANAQLIHMVPKPLDLPSIEHHLTMDASAGVYAPSATTIEEIYRGDTAVALNMVYSAVTAQQRDEAIHDKAKSYFDDFSVASSSFDFDKSKREFHLVIKGTAKLNWKDGWFDVPTSSIGFDPDFDRTAGALHDVPLAIDYPRYVKDQAVVQLPPAFAAQQKLADPVHETLAGVEYARTETVNGGVLTVDSSERSIGPEIPYKEALAAAPQIRGLSKNDIYLRMDPSYKPTDRDLAALKDSKPQSADDFFVRAYAELTHNQIDDGLADLNSGLAVDPKDTWALKKRVWINLTRQHFDDAQKDLDAVVSIDPTDSDIFAYRGELAMVKGDINGASAAFDQALQRDPKNSFARIGRSRILIQQGKLDDAIRELTTALATDPHNATALSKRAELLEGKNDHAGADRDIAAALAAEPNNASVLASRAWIAIGRKDWDTAKQFVAKTLAQDPNNSYASGLQQQLLKRDGHEDQALASLDSAVTKAPNDPNALINRAFAYIDAKNFEAADKDIAAALAIEPGNIRALRARAAVATATGNYPAAVTALTAALARSPSDAEILTSRAEAYRQLRKFDLALADTSAAMKNGLVSPSLRLLRINILVSQGNMSAVPAEIEQLLKENPTSDLAFVVAGKTYVALGMRDKAMASFDRALAIKPYAYIYLNREQVRPYSDLQGKLADLDAALKLEPDAEDVLAEKARLLSKAGKHAEALELYDRAIKNALDSSDLKLARAVALERAGRPADAKTAFDEVRAKAKTAGDYSQMCWVKATNGVVLESALDDCRRAHELDPTYPDIDENLGFVLLRLGKLREALAELDKAVAGKSGADAYMARSIVRSRLGDSAGARSDATEAHRLRGDIDDRFAEFGLDLEQHAGSIAAAH